jgi:hypothetical protein
MRLFDEGEPPIPLRLISSQTFETGVLNLVYAPAESAGNAGYNDAKVHLSQPEPQDRGHGRFAKPSSGLEPKTPSLPWRFPSVTPTDEALAVGRSVGNRPEICDHGRLRPVKTIRWSRNQ